MASQPLETIPEEPTPAPTTTPTPTPTPTPARVTADPPQTKPSKNPGRVASGKRLAERNRLAREAKKQAQAEAASPATTTASASNTTTATASDNNNNLSLVTVLEIGGLIVSMLGVYYQREAIRARCNPAPPAQPAPAPTPAPSRIPVKRGIKEME